MPCSGDSGRNYSDIKTKNKIEIRPNKINQCTVVKSSYIPPQVLQAPTHVSHCPLHWFAIYREFEL